VKAGPLIAALIWIELGTAARAAPDLDPLAIEQGLIIPSLDGSGTDVVDLEQALHRLNIPSVSMAVVSDDRIAWARAYGAASDTLYQAASMSKTVAAVVALCLVQTGRLGLDRDINGELASWHVPDTELTRDRPVTLRGLLSMTAGLNVPGYLGYGRGAALPSLVQILNGTPPANSPAVRVTQAAATRSSRPSSSRRRARPLRMPLNLWCCGRSA
jgi:CubicO group peptidase (beta-lactamase class C family)